MAKVFKLYHNCRGSSKMPQKRNSIASFLKGGFEIADEHLGAPATDPFSNTHCTELVAAKQSLGGSHRTVQRQA